MSSGRKSGQPSERAAEAPARYDATGSVSNALAAPLSLDEISQIAARLRLTPSERLRYLEDMIAFEEEAHRARRVT